MVEKGLYNSSKVKKKDEYKGIEQEGGCFFLFVSKSHFS